MDFITYIGSDQRVHWLPWGKTRVELHVKAMFKIEDLLPFPKTFNFLCFELRRGCNSVTLSSCMSRR